MSSLEILFVALFVIYITECVVVVPMNTTTLRVSANGVQIVSGGFVLRGLKRKLLLSPIMPSASGLALCKSDEDCLRTQPYENALDLKRIRVGWRFFVRYAYWLVFEVQLQAIILFVITPILVTLAGSFALLGLLPIWFALHLHIVWLYARLARHDIFHAKKRSEEIVMLLLSPPFVLRAPDLLLRQAFSEFHWLAVANALGTGKEVVSKTHGYLRRLKYPAAWEQPADADSKQCFSSWKAAVFQVAAQWGYGLNLAAPNPNSDLAQRYCPRCSEQFTIAATMCPDCGIPLFELRNRRSRSTLSSEPFDTATK